MSASPLISIQSQPASSAFFPAQSPILIPAVSGRIRYPDGRTVNVEQRSVQVGDTCPAFGEFQRSQELLRAALQSNAILWEALVATQASLQENRILLKETQKTLECTLGQNLKMNLELQNRSQSNIQKLTNTFEEKMSARTKRKKTD